MNKRVLGFGIAAISVVLLVGLLLTPVTAVPAGPGVRDCGTVLAPSDGDGGAPWCADARNRRLLWGVVPLAGFVVGTATFAGRHE